MKFFTFNDQHETVLDVENVRRVSKHVSTFSNTFEIVVDRNQVISYNNEAMRDKDYSNLVAFIQDNETLKAKLGEIYCVGALVHAENIGLLKFIGAMHGYDKLANDFAEDWQKTFDSMQEKFISSAKSSSQKETFDWSTLYERREK